MTNFQIIANTAIAEGLYTQEQVEAIFQSGHELPLHTYNEWKRAGYQVKKGEHAALSCDIWMPKTKTKKADYKQGGNKDEQRSNFYKKRAHFFLYTQVEPIEKEA